MTSQRFSRRSLLAGLLLALSPLSALAARPAPVVLSAEDAALVQQAVTYMQGLSTAKGRFVQTDARGAVSEGVFYLSRPGKARFEYDPPSNIVMASNGHHVSILNQRLKTFQSYPLGATPLALFLAREIRLDRGVVVTRVTRLADGFSITAQDGRKEAEGRIVLSFVGQPIRLAGWIVTDAQGQSTRVRLLDFAPTGPLGGQLFELKDPRPRPGMRP